MLPRLVRKELVGVVWRVALWDGVITRHTAANEIRLRGCHLLPVMKFPRLWTPEPVLVLAEMCRIVVVGSCGVDVVQLGGGVCDGLLGVGVRVDSSE